MPVDTCNILGTLTDIGVSNIDAKVVVTNYNTFIDSGTSPETIIPKSIKTFTITAGAVNLVLPQTETARVSVRLQFYKRLSTSPDVYDTETFLDLYAVIPNVSTYQLSGLLDVGIVNDSLATGARRVARTIFEDSSLVALISSSLKTYTQTTKPSGVADNSLWFDPDKGILWFFDSVASRWISTEKQATISNTISSNSTINFPICSGISNNILVKTCLFNYAVISPNNSTNFWRWKRSKKLWVNSTADVDTTYIDSSTRSPAVRYDHTYTENSTYDLNTLQNYGLLFEKAGTSTLPGNLQITACLNYHFILPA
jgi:hypothetical protein